MHHGNNCKSIDNFKESGKRDDEDDDDDVKEVEEIEKWWSSVNIRNL